MECLCHKDNKYRDLITPSTGAVWRARAVYSRMIWADLKDGFLTSSNIQTIPETFESIIMQVNNSVVQNRF